MSATFSKVKPLLDRVLVKRIVAATHSPGGVMLPESAQKHLNQGVVVSVGPGRVTSEGKRVEMGVKTGDTVLLPEYGGNTVSIDKEDMVLYRDEDILGVIEK
uniref:10 kDa chaperonin n=1 Tax=Spongospora subterranea TaxID=70186 RepID=A0A0H5R3U8_9EUKA|eukprot:CRZ08798.1 hypothetical protein [Spongospora subterranea]